MKSLQHSAVNYCLGIEGRLQILCRLTTHESAGSYCKDQLNILRATADTWIPQSLFLHWFEHQHLKTGLRRHVPELRKAVGKRGKIWLHPDPAESSETLTESLRGPCWTTKRVRDISPVLPGEVRSVDHPH